MNCAIEIDAKMPIFFCSAVNNAPVLFTNPSCKAEKTQKSVFPSSCVTTTERSHDLLGKLTHLGIHTVAGTALVCKPPIDVQDHLAELWFIFQFVVLISEPDELVLNITLADVHVQFDKRLINDVVERIRLHGVERALDGNRPPVVRA